MTDKYRDGLFRDYFKDKTRLLSLCNALLGTDGTNTDELEINTLDGIFFERLQNDISCVYRGKIIVMVEQQSTINENMPLRCLLYVSEIFKQYAEEAKSKIYQRKLIPLPRTEIFVLYNGKGVEAERREMRLSDAFGGAASVEVIVQVYNINAGMNEEFINRSKPLKEYCSFVNRVMGNIAAGMSYERAIAETFDYCKNNDLMVEYLSKRHWELISMLGFEYNEEDAKRAWIEYGVEQGIEQGIEQGTKNTKIDMIKNLLIAETPIKYIIKATGLSEAEIRKIAEARYDNDIKN